MILADVSDAFPPWSGTPNTEAQSIFNTAVSFHEGAIRCGSMHLDGENYVAPTAPTIACYAMAAEMYLKALLLRQGTPKSGHRLNVLFAALAASTRDTVRQNLGAFQGETPERLMTSLQELSSAFVDWRYIYEIVGGRRIYVGALVDITAALYRTGRILGRWQVSDYLNARLDTPLSELAVVESRGSGSFLKFIVSHTPPVR